MTLAVTLFIAAIVAIIVVAILYFCYLFECFGRFDFQTDDRIGRFPSEEGQELTAVVVPTERKPIENEIFERSLDLISKFKPYYKNVRERYRNEYNASENGRIEWHNVFTTDFTRVKGTAYVSAIDLISKLLSEIDSPEKEESIDWSTI